MWSLPDQSCSIVIVSWLTNQNIPAGISYSYSSQGTHISLNNNRSNTWWKEKVIDVKRRPVKIDTTHTKISWPMKKRNINIHKRNTAKVQIVNFLKTRNNNCFPDVINSDNMLTKPLTGSMTGSFFGESSWRVNLSSPSRTASAKAWTTRVFFDSVYKQ